MMSSYMLYADNISMKLQSETYKPIKITSMNQEIAVIDYRSYYA